MSRHLQARVPDEIADRVDQIAQALGETRTTIVIAALRRWVADWSTSPALLSAVMPPADASMYPSSEADQ
jgi:predicted transcriptional regulator